LWIAASAIIAVLLLVGYAAANVFSEDPEVRISARRLDDGRTEFALQQRTDGQWGERILPRARMFPAQPRDDRWLNSSPLTITTEHAAIVRDIGQNHYDDGRIATDVSVHDYDHSGVRVLDTIVRVVENGEHRYSEGPAYLAVYCVNGQLSYWLGPLLLEGHTEKWGHIGYDLSYSLSGDLGEHSNISSGDFWVPAYDSTRDFQGPGGRVSELPAYVAVGMRSATSLQVTLTGADDETLTVTFTLDGLWDTPVQPNIDRCGTYY